MSTGVPTVLVIDDDEDIRDIVEVILSADGMRVLSARDGLEGLARLREGSPPALILLDLMMPNLDGLGFLEAMRSDPGVANVPVVVMSGNTEPRGVHEFKGLYYLSKPVHLDDLLATVRRFALPASARPEM